VGGLTKNILNKLALMGPGPGLAAPNTPGVCEKFRLAHDTARGGRAQDSVPRLRPGFRHLNSAVFDQRPVMQNILFPGYRPQLIELSSVREVR
jgi:hypothetical protein